MGKKNEVYMDHVIMVRLTIFISTPCTQSGNHGRPTLFTVDRSFVDGRVSIASGRMIEAILQSKDTCGIVRRCTQGNLNGEKWTWVGEIPG